MSNGSNIAFFSFFCPLIAAGVTCPKANPLTNGRGWGDCIGTGNDWALNESGVVWLGTDPDLGGCEYEGEVDAIMMWDGYEAVGTPCRLRFVEPLEALLEALVK